MSISRPAANAQVESNDKGGHVTRDAGSGRGNRSGDASDNWSGVGSDGQR